MRRWACAAFVFLAAAPAMADGGRLRVRQEAGPFVISVFTAPEPLSAGPADVSVLVQDRASGEVRLGAQVELRLRGPDSAAVQALAASPGVNRLLKAAVVDLSAPGDWSLEVTAREGGLPSQVSCVLPVAARATRLAGVWPLLAFPPLAVALFGVERTLRARRKRMGYSSGTH